MDDKIRFQMRISPETDRKVKASISLANCQSQNEFVEKALEYYCANLLAEDSATLLAPALVEAMRATVKESENHICRLIFKLAVELGILMNVVAYGMEIDPAVLDQLRNKCVQEIKRTNGIITFKDAVNYQNGL